MKLNVHLLTLAAGLAVLLFSCKNEVKTPAAPTSPSAPTTETPASVKPEAVVYAALVNDLRFRETPDATGKVVGKVAKGKLIFATGKRSENQVTMPFSLGEETDYFYEVSMKEVPNAWVFGPAMLKIFAGKTADMPGDEFQEFAFALGKLPQNSLESGGKAYNLLKTMCPKGGDEAFILMEKTMWDLQFDPKVSSLLEKPGLQAKLEKEGEKIWQNTFDHSKFPETKKLAENGLKVTTAEGSYFPTTDYKMLKSALAGSLSPATAAFLDQTIVEDLDPTGSDGGIIIDSAELVKRAIFWENWTKNNPNHVLAERAANDALWLASDILGGMNNTPVFDYETGKIYPEAQNTWDLVLKNHPNSMIAKRILEIQALVKEDGGKRGPKTEAYLQKMMEAAM